MKKFLLFVISLIGFISQLSQTSAAFISPEELLNAENMRTALHITDEQAQERIKVVYYYADFWYKNMYVLFNKYIPPEYDDYVYYERLADMQEDPLFKSYYTLWLWWSEDNATLIVGNEWKYTGRNHRLYWWDQDRFLKTKRILIWNDPWSFTYWAKQFVSGNMDYSFNNSFAFKTTADAEKMFKKILLNSFNESFLTEWKEYDGYYHGCNGEWLDYFARGEKTSNFAADNPVANSDSFSQLPSENWRCTITNKNPDLAKFKNSVLQFLSGSNSYYNPKTTEVDPEYGSYINFYQNKDNLPILVDQMFSLPDWYGDIKMPLVKKATTWGVNVQEKYPSPYEINNVIFNPNTSEINDYIVGVIDMYWDVAYAKYGPNKGRINLSWEFFYDAKMNNPWLPKSIYKDPVRSVNENIFNLIYDTHNTLSDKPHYYSTYSGPKLSADEIRNIQDGASVTTSSSSSNSSSNSTQGTNSSTSGSSGNSIGLFDKTLSILLDGKQYTVNKYIGVYFRARDDLYQYYVANFLKPFLDKTKMTQSEYMADVGTKINIVLKNFNNRNLTNAQRNAIIAKLNDKFTVFKLMQIYKGYYAKNNAKYQSNYLLLLEVFYILNYDTSLLNKNEAGYPEYFKTIE